jgi:hypothetical protein
VSLVHVTYVFSLCFLDAGTAETPLVSHAVVSNENQLTLLHSVSLIGLIM